MEYIGKILTMYKCNITNNKFLLKKDDIGREKCNYNGFTSRDRAIVYCLMNKFDFPKTALSEIVEKNLTGIGMSDSDGLSSYLSNSFNYINTFFHKEPFLDIYNTEHIKLYQNLDFIICSDVFEHIDPYPGLNIAFSHLYSMLKKISGVLIFSVPYNTAEHIEHFPSLYKYNIIQKNDTYVLQNIDKYGKLEEFTNLIFHGGPGQTLEMRQFSQNSLLQYLYNAGFKNITFHSIDQEMNEFGIFWECPVSLVVSANT